MMEPGLVAVGGALGAMLRYVVGVYVGVHRYPWATLLVNALGSLLLGVVLVVVGSSEVFLLVGVGFCGALTTFSTFSYQTVGLWERGMVGLAVVNAVANLLVSLGAFVLAWILLG